MLEAQLGGDLLSPDTSPAAHTTPSSAEAEHQVPQQSGKAGENDSLPSFVSTVRGLPNGAYKF